MTKVVNENGVLTYLLPLDYTWNRIERALSHICERCHLGGVGPAGRSTERRVGSGLKNIGL
jgi:hypothetical protein